MSNILKYQNPSSPLLPAAIKIGYTYKPDISRSTKVEGATPITDLQELSKKEKSSLYEAYDFYANDVYPRKQKYNGSYNPEIHNMDNLTKRVIFREPLNFKNGFNRGGYAPIYLPSESSQIPNFLTPIVTRKPRDFGNTVLHEATHAEDGDSFKTDNFKLGESMTDEEVKLLDDAYKFEYEDDMTRAEKQTTNREFRFGLSRLTGLYLDDLTDYINNLSTKELKKLYKKINPGYKELMVKPKYDDDWGDAVKKALIQVGQNTIDPNHIDYRDPVTFAKKGGRIHIKKKNRGKFTEYCGGKVTEECIAKGKKSKDPKIRKRATFASNSRRWKHENGGMLKAQEGATVSSERIPTLEEYIQMKQQEARQMALANSYKATKPRLAKKYYSDEDVKLLEIDGEVYKDVADKYTEDIYKYENMLRQPFTPSHVFVPNPRYMIDGQTTGAQGDNLFNRYQDAIENASYYEQGYKEILDRLELIKKTGYDWTGYNCITNATGWYGDPYVCASNIDFKKDPSKYGFVEINVDDALPGDIFQYDGDYGPYHATMYSKKGDNSLYYGNYANGNYTEPIKHDSPYWGKGQRAFRFIGLPEDIEAWTREYNELYSKKLGGVLNEFKKGGVLKTQEGTPKYGLPGGVPTYMQIQPFSPIDIAIKTAQVQTSPTTLPPGVKEVVGPDGKKVAIRTEQPLVPLEQSIAEWLPGTGDVAEIGYIANDVKNGNYGTAALATAMVALPGNVGKVFRKLDVPTSKLTEAERLGIPKGERNQPLNGHLKGDAAVQMFKEYGTTIIPSNSKIYFQIQQLVPEARERYKLVGRTDITDDEIAGSLYKRAMELSGNSNAAIWETGEPRLLFRGDTRRYNRLMDKWSPEKLAKGKGTMDNSLGNLFLGDISGKGQGVDRYFISGTDFFEPRIQGSATGARGKFGTIFDGGGEGVQGTTIPYIPKDAYKLSTYQTYAGPYSLYKFPGKYSESGISDLNTFIIRTPAMRDATGEISVLADDIVMKTKNYRGPNIDDYDGPTYDGINSTVRDAMAKHYQSILDDAQSKGQGLLFSEGLTDEYVKKFEGIHPFRREHERYDYYALPNFNRQNAKHLFGWDLRRPIQWDVDNIYLEEGGKL